MTLPQFSLNVVTLLFLVVYFTPSEVRGHGNMVMPFNWFDVHKWGWASREQCSAGCDIDKNKLCSPGACDHVLPDFGGYGCSCLWFTNSTKIRGQPSLKSELRTYNVHMDTPNTDLDWTRFNPWRRPGSAPIFSPCGAAGGNPDGCEGDCPDDAYAKGPNAENVDLANKPVTEWRRGSAVEVAWGITANHGGGYSYRLCKLPSSGPAGLTEECFQKTPLQFVGNTQWIQEGWFGKRTEIRARRTTEGTVPSGSQWTMNPIPACKNHHGGFYSEYAGCKGEGTQHPPPAPGIFGYGSNIYGTAPALPWSIVDKVRVPPGLTAGAYVLSFRWDCEQTPQVWNTCADIQIV